MPIEALEAEVLGLPVAERSRLLERLIASLDADPAVEQAWMLEVRRRDEEVDTGTVQVLSGESVLAGLRAGLK